MLRIHNLALHDVGNFYEMALDFGPGLSILCGPNGVGKTTVLDAIASIFIASYSHTSLRRRAGAEQGTISFSATWDEKPVDGIGVVTNFNPNEQAHPFGKARDAATQLIYVKSSRDFHYTRLDGVLRDPDNRPEHY